MKHERNFTPRLHPWSAKLNLRSQLSSVTLGDVLAGYTCSPISLSDFEKYLNFNEHSLENLQFVVWFQDYRTRFKLSQTNSDVGDLGQETVPAFPSVVEKEHRSVASMSKLGSASSPSRKHEYSGKRPEICPSPSHESRSRSLHNECLRIVSTFLRPGAPKELCIDAVVRETAIRSLAFSFDFDVFLPVYEEVYSLLENNSVPRFLELAGTNINLPRQWFWYICGALCFISSITISLVLIFLLPTPPERNLAWRTIPVLVAGYGGGCVLSAWRGWCSQVWRRGHRQLRTWEMQEMDEESRTFVERVLNPSCKVIELISADRSAIAPFSQKNGEYSTENPSHRSEGVVPNSQFKELSSPLSNINFPGHVQPKDSRAHAHSRPQARPPVFGPEAVVQDPRVKAIHRRIFFEVACFALFCSLLFSAIVYPIPGQLHHRSPN